MSHYCSESENQRSLRPDIVFVTAVRNFQQYDRYVRLNDRNKRYDFAVFDNVKENKPVPVLYNAFLETYDYSRKAWFVFCHEDFEFLEDPGIVLGKLATNRLYGPIGSKNVGFLGFGRQVVLGSIKWTKKGDEVSSDKKLGRYLTRPTKVETFDCCCLIVHSSLVKNARLRFDNNLEFDMYVEDFCAAAYEYHKICSYAIQIDACHHSDANATERLWRHLPYLAEKYKNRCYSGVLTYFGKPSWQKRLQDLILPGREKRYK